MNSYLENPIVGLYILYVLNMHANFDVNQMLFAIRSINSYFMYYFKLQKLEFKQLIDKDIVICHSIHKLILILNYFEIL